MMGGAKKVSDLAKLTKEELIEKYEDLESEYNNLDDLYSELENNITERILQIEELEDKLESKQENAIIDKDKFVRQLEQQNLITEELREFIESYMSLITNVKFI